MHWLHKQEFQLPPLATRSTVHSLWPFPPSLAVCKTEGEGLEDYIMWYCYISNTRNTHVHLYLEPVHRLCVRVICGCRWGIRGMCYVSCRSRRSCLVFVVSKSQWPCRTVVPDLHLHRQRTLSSPHLSRAYLNVSDCVTHIWPILMVCNNIPHDIPDHEHDPPLMYLVRIDPWFRASH